MSFLLLTTNRANGTVKSYLKALLAISFVIDFDVVLSSTLVFERKSPEFNTLKIKRSPSSPYFPVNVSIFSIEGVSIGE